MSFLKGEVALLTGASSGIGWETARALARSGAKVALAARRKDKLEELAALIGTSTEVLIVPCDVSDPAQGRAAVKAVLEKWGGLDILINNAGVMATRHFHEQELSEIESVMRTNYTGAAALIQAALPGMLKQGEGHIVNVASMAGILGFPFMASYCASKHALVGLTEALRREYRGTGVTFTAFCPGSVETPMTAETLGDEKLGKLARPKTAAQVAAKIVDACRTKAPEVLYGDAPGLVVRLAALMPGLFDRVVSATYKRLHPLARKSSS